MVNEWMDGCSIFIYIWVDSQFTSSSLTLFRIKRNEFLFFSFSVLKWMYVHHHHSFIHSWVFHFNSPIYTALGIYIHNFHLVLFSLHCIHFYLLQARRTRIKKTNSKKNSFIMELYTRERERKKEIWIGKK